MSFGSKPPSPPQLPPTPKPQEILDVIDEITGTQAITVTGSDGKKKRVISKLPRTPEEERIFTEGQELITTALQNLKTLYQQQPNRLIDYQPLMEVFTNINDERARDLEEIANIGNIDQDIQEFRTINRNLLDEEFRRINNAQEEGLAQRGHYNSTAGDALRAQLAREEVLARQQAELNAQAYGQNLANQQLNRNMTAFGLREEGRRGRLGQAERALSLAEAQRNQLEEQHREAIQNNVTQLQIGSNLTGQDMARAMATQAPQLGLQQFIAANQNQLNHHNAEVNRLNTNFQNQMQAYNARPPSFGETVGRLGMMGAGAALGSMAGGFGSSIGGNLGSMFADRFFPTQQRAN